MPPKSGLDALVLGQDGQAPDDDDSESELSILGETDEDADEAEAAAPDLSDGQPSDAESESSAAWTESDDEDGRAVRLSSRQDRAVLGGRKKVCLREFERLLQARAEAKEVPAWAREDEDSDVFAGRAGKRVRRAGVEAETADETLAASKSLSAVASADIEDKHRYGTTVGRVLPQLHSKRLLNVYFPASAAGEAEKHKNMAHGRKADKVIASVFSPSKKLVACLRTRELVVVELNQNAVMALGGGVLSEAAEEPVARVGHRVVARVVQRHCKFDSCLFASEDTLVVFADEHRHVFSVDLKNNEVRKLGRLFGAADETATRRARARDCRAEVAEHLPAPCRALPSLGGRPVAAEKRQFLTIGTRYVQVGSLASVRCSKWFRLQEAPVAAEWLDERHVVSIDTAARLYVHDVSQGAARCLGWHQLDNCLHPTELACTTNVTGSYRFFSLKDALARDGSKRTESSEDLPTRSDESGEWGSFVVAVGSQTGHVDLLLVSLQPSGEHSPDTHAGKPKPALLTLGRAGVQKKGAGRTPLAPVFVPVACLPHLLTPISTLCFHRNVLVFASQFDSNAIRQYDMVKRAVLAKFPVQTAPFGRVGSVCASDNYFIVGNRSGNAVVYKGLVPQEADA